MTQCCDDKTSIILSFVIGFYLVGGFVNKLLKEPLEPSNIIIDTLKFLAWSTFLLVALGYFSTQTFLTIFKVITTSIITFVRYLLYVGYIGPNGIQQPPIRPPRFTGSGTTRGNQETQENPTVTNEEPKYAKKGTVKSTYKNNIIDELKKKDNRPKKPFEGKTYLDFEKDEDGPFITEDNDKKKYGVYQLSSGSISQVVGGRQNIQVITEQDAAGFENNNNNNNVPITRVRNIPVTFSRSYEQSYGAKLDRGEEATFEFPDIHGQYDIPRENFNVVDTIVFTYPDDRLFFPANDINVTREANSTREFIESLFLEIYTSSWYEYIYSGRFHEGINYFEEEEENIVNEIIGEYLEIVKETENKELEDIKNIEKYIRAMILQAKNIYQASIDIIEQYTDNIERNVSQFEQELFNREMEYRESLLYIARIYISLTGKKIRIEEVTYDMINELLSTYLDESNRSVIELKKKFDAIQRLLKFHDLYDKLIKPNEGLIIENNGKFIRNNSGIRTLNGAVILVKHWLRLGKKIREAYLKGEDTSQLKERLNKILEKLKELESREAVNIFIEIMNNPIKRKDINIFFNFILRE